LILSAKFLPVAPLLLLFVPAELLRILAETIGMPLLARRRLKSFTFLYAFQTAIFVGGAALALPYFGLAGAAAAYGTATTLWALATFVTCRFHFPLKLEARTALGLLRAAGLLGVAMAVGFMLPFGVVRLLIVAAACFVWFAWTLQDQGA